MTVYQFGDNDLTERWTWDSEGRAVYHGQAKAGTADDSANWRISKFSYTGTSYNYDDKKWADGTADFSKVWDDLAEYTY